MNPLVPIIFFFGKAMFRHAILITFVAAISGYLLQTGQLWAGYVVWISLIMLATLIIWRAGDFFSPAAEFVQQKYDIPQSIKAAVLDAIASSFPEFCVAIIAVIMIGQAEVGISTIVGSALYNVLVIPAAAGLVAASPMTISREVVWRDNVFYLGVVILLAAMLWFFPNQWGAGVAVSFLIGYAGYVVLLQRDFKKSKQNPQQKVVEIEPEVTEEDDELLELTSEKHAWIWIISMMAVMGGASHLLVESSLELGLMLDIEPVIMGFVVIAAGTSVPDTALSVISAKKGQYDAAISNVFGSNIFDICICLSIPILMALAMNGEPTQIELPQMGLIWSLLGATVFAMYLFWSNNYTLTKPKAAMMGFTYLMILVIAFSF